MKQSTNYNMNKPDPNDMFSLEHWNQNTDKIDETLVPTFEDYTGETPVPTTDEALKNIKSKTKLSILMQNIKAFCKGCCTLGMLVDNCVTNNNNLPLAASQGKILMDQITSLNNNLHMTSESKRITVNGNQHNIKIDKIGNLLCVCNITLNTVTFNGSAFDVYTDPFDVSYRPKSTCVSPLSINGGEAMMEVMMLPDGRINLWNPNYKGNATMPMRGTLIWTV